MRQQFQSAPLSSTSMAPAHFEGGAALDLNQEIAQLRADASLKEEAGHKTKMLARYPEFRIVLISMKAGTRWQDHKTNSRILVQVLCGQIQFHTPNGIFDLHAGQLLALNPDILHSVDAPEESAFLLTLFSAPDR